MVFDRLLELVYWHDDKVLDPPLQPLKLEQAHEPNLIEDPWYSRLLDVHRWSDHPDVHRLVDAIWVNHFGDYVAGSAKPDPKPKRIFEQQLRIVILDLFVAWLEHPRLCIGVSMNVNAWNTGSRYNALHISKKITNIIERLRDVQLLEYMAGSYSGVDGYGNHTTRIRASETLQQMFRDANFNREDIVQAPNQECIILKGTDVADDNSKPVEYAETDETNRMRAELTAYNAVLSDAFINIPSLELAVVERDIKNGKAIGTTAKVPLDHHHHFIRRIFSRGDWGLNGRFYGGWWQQVGADYRRQILINDTPTVEVDFKGLHIATLSAEKGVAVDGDPYELPVGLVPDVPAGLQRSLVKHLVLTALNAPNTRSAFQSFRDGWPTGHKGKTQTNAELELLLAGFTQKHPHLADRVCADQGIRLMNVDGRIAELVHRHFTEQGVPVLSVHDSYIIDYTRVLELKQVMQAAAMTVVGVTLAVSTEASGLDEFRAGGVDPEVLLDFVQWSQPVRSVGYLQRLAAWERAVSSLGKEEGEAGCSGWVGRRKLELGCCSVP